MIGFLIGFFFGVFFGFFVAMRLTKEEKEICKQYSKRDENNTVHCNECPLVINTAWTLCKANCRAEEWREHLDETN